MPSTRIFIADADSTDGTRQAAETFLPYLALDVIPGGLPSVGRNLGAERASSRFVLFMDADVVPASRSLVRRSVEIALRQNLQCVTTNIICREGNLLDRGMYGVNNMFQHLSKLHRPFSTGMFMLFDLARFRELGGFHRDVHFAEDYHLSQRVDRRRFAIIPGGVHTGNRRFEKIGHARAARLFFAAAFNFWNEDFFLRDHHYWDTVGEN